MSKPVSTPSLPAPKPAEASAAKAGPVFHDPKHHIKIYQGDCLEILAAVPENSVDLVFADPPYFLSNGGITCHAGRMVSVNKGEWDKSKGADANHEFNRAWLAACQPTGVLSHKLLKTNGRLLNKSSDLKYFTNSLDIFLVRS
jgi:site-specific DNA-methyltransferase (adenine-specific)